MENISRIEALTSWFDRSWSVWRQQEASIFIRGNLVPSAYVQTILREVDYIATLEVAAEMGYIFVTATDPIWGRALRAFETIETEPHLHEFVDARLGHVERFERRLREGRGARWELPAELLWEFLAVSDVPQARTHFAVFESILASPWGQHAFDQAKRMMSQPRYLARTVIGLKETDEVVVALVLEIDKAFGFLLKCYELLVNLREWSEVHTSVYKYFEDSVWPLRRVSGDLNECVSNMKEWPQSADPGSEEAVKQHVERVQEAVVGMLGGTAMPLEAV